MSVLSERRRALIVAASNYHDARLNTLRAPATDAEALARVLGDTTIGGFDVETSLDEPWWEVRGKLDEFLSGGESDDLLLVHFACHGVKALDGELFFALSNTELGRLQSTALSTEFVNDLMDSSRARRIMLLLDCCYSGAFARGMKTRAGGSVDVMDRLSGRGRAVLTASTAMEYAFEGDDRSGKGTPSVFTSAVVRGLETGDADRDRDGFISFDELYDYVYDQVRSQTPNQTPSKSALQIHGRLYIARSPRQAELPEELRDASHSPFAGVREGAVLELERLLYGNHPGLANVARAMLEYLTNDDSRGVSQAARAALDAPKPRLEEAPDSDGRTGTEPVPPPGEGPLPPADTTVETNPTAAPQRRRFFDFVRSPKGLFGAARARSRPVWIVAVLVVTGLGAGLVMLFALPSEAKAQVKLPPSSQQVALAVSDGSLFLADPTGRLIQLNPDGNSLRLGRVVEDPNHPRSIAAAGHRLYTLNDTSLMVGPPDNPSEHATPLADGQALASSGSQVAVAAGNTKARTGRLCLVGTSASLDACASPLKFFPSGLGITTTAGQPEVFVADQSAGTIVPFTRIGSQLKPGVPIPVGPEPHGTLPRFPGSSMSHLHVPSPSLT